MQACLPLFAAGCLAHASLQLDPHLPNENPSFSMTNYTRADLVFWVCLAPRNHSVIAWKTFYQRE